MSLCIQYINGINSYCTSAHVVRLGGSACTPNKGMQLCKGLPHCTQLRELELELELLDTNLHNVV